MPEQVDEQEKTRRSNIMLEMNAEKMKKYEQLWIGQDVDVLFEEITEKDGARYAVGHTKEYLRIMNPCGDDSEEQWINQIKTITLKNNSQIMH